MTDNLRPSPVDRCTAGLQSAPSRRQFIETSLSSAASTAIIGATLLGTTAASLPRSVHAAGGDDTLRVGLIGCGGRGTGAARQALMADQRVKLVAMADVFAEPLQTSLKALSADAELIDKIDVPPERGSAS